MISFSGGSAFRMTTVLYNLDELEKWWARPYFTRELFVDPYSVCKGEFIAFSYRSTYILHPIYAIYHLQSVVDNLTSTNCTGCDVMSRKINLSNYYTNYRASSMLDIATILGM